MRIGPGEASLGHFASVGPSVCLEHGRLEVDDSSVKWIGADGLLCRIPLATVSALNLGSSITVTHAPTKAPEG